MLRQDWRLHVVLERAGFAGARPIWIARDLRGLSFQAENRSGEPHELTFRVEGLAGRGCRAAGPDGAELKLVARDDGTTTFSLLLPREGAAVELRLA